MIKRIFLAVNLPKKVKEQLLSYRQKWPELPARWTKLENLHLTLVFYGNAADDELEEIQQAVKVVVKKHKPFSLKLSRIVYGPSVSEARMIWAVGLPAEVPSDSRGTKAGDTLLTLQKELAVALERVEEREFSLHITLARFQEWEFRKIPLEERPEIDEEINLEIPVNSIEVMESKVRRGGAEYSICESISLA